MLIQDTLQEGKVDILDGCISVLVLTRVIQKVIWVLCFQYK